MYYVGIDLHKRFAVAAIEDDSGRTEKPQRFDCHDVGTIARFFENHRPFKAVIEASSSCRWFYELLEPLGEVSLAHPLRLRAIVAGRAKTDKLDAALLARLLRAEMIPLAYVPPQPYQQLRDLTRARARITQRMNEAKNELHALLTRANLHSPYVTTFSKRGRAWLQALELRPPGTLVRDELLRRLEHYEREVVELDCALERMIAAFPEVEALRDLHGIGLYSSLLIVGEIAEPGRFTNGRQIGAYAGLTARVSQSGDSSYHGHITRQGSPWLRWILVQAAMKIVQRDVPLRNFYTRIRKRSSAKIARVATARKLAGICWVRLMRWHRLNTQAAA